MNKGNEFAKKRSSDYECAASLAAEAFMYTKHNNQQAWKMSIPNFGAMTICLFALGHFSCVGAQQHTNPALPSCGVGQVKDGDPGTGSSVIDIKFQPGCVIPWHWHTPNERVVIVSGSAKAEMKGMETVMLKQGDFILLSAKQIHQFTALTPVEIFDFSDAPFDIHYVDATGNEIPYKAALAPKPPSTTKP